MRTPDIHTTWIEANWPADLQEVYAGSDDISLAYGVPFNTDLGLLAALVQAMGSAESAAILWSLAINDPCPDVPVDLTLVLELLEPSGLFVTWSRVEEGPIPQSLRDAVSFGMPVLVEMKPDVSHNRCWWGLLDDVYGDDPAILSLISGRQSWADSVRHWSALTGTYVWIKQPIPGWEVKDE